MGKGPLRNLLLAHQVGKSQKKTIATSAASHWPLGNGWDVTQINSVRQSVICPCVIWPKLTRPIRQQMLCASRHWFSISHLRSEKAVIDSPSIPCLTSLGITEFLLGIEEFPQVSVR